jgi:hypothetical protein
VSDDSDFDAVAAAVVASENTELDDAEAFEMEGDNPSGGV